MTEYGGPRGGGKSFLCMAEVISRLDGIPFEEALDMVYEMAYGPSRNDDSEDD